MRNQKIVRALRSIEKVKKAYDERYRELRQTKDKIICEKLEIIIALGCKYEEIEPLVEVSFELDEHNDVLAEIKKCSTCHKEKPATAEYFFRSKNILCGLSSKCKVCRKRERVSR